MKDRALELLHGLGDGTCTQAEVASLAAEVLSDPPPIVAAARRALAAIGTEHEGVAAVEFLGLLAGW